MKNKFPHSLIFFVLAAVLLGGCATAPPVPSFETRRGDRVGILVDIGDNPTHTHVGTTIFNNFEKRYPHRWDLDAAVAGALKDTLSQAGFEAVDLEAQGLRHVDLAALVVENGQAWAVASGREGAARDLAQRRGLRAVVLVKEQKTMAHLECHGGPCTERYTSGAGLYTRSILGLTTRYAVPAFGMHVYLLDPPADLARTGPLRSLVARPAVLLPAGAGPANLEQVSGAEWRTVRDAIVAATRRTAAEIAKALNPK